MSDWLTWVRACECGKVHIDVWKPDGEKIGDSDKELIRSLRNAIEQIKRGTAERTPAAHREH